MELNKFIGMKIKSFRESRSMTQDELAELLNTTRQSISRYENGERKANQDLLFELASIFKVSLDDFFPARNLYDQSNIIRVTPDNMVAIPIIGTIACGDHGDSLRGCKIKCRTRCKTNAKIIDFLLFSSVFLNSKNNKKRRHIRVFNSLDVAFCFSFTSQEDL